MARWANVNAVRYIQASDLGIPAPVWGTLSDNAPFSWGDNQHSLISAQRLIDRIYDCEVQDKCVDALDILRDVLDDIFIDLES